AVEYNCSLAKTSREEAEALYRNIYEMKQFLSGRTLWVGETRVGEQYPMANYNCAFEVIDNFHAYHDLFYLLMVGSGVGVRVLKSDAAKLPRVRTNLKLLHEMYQEVPKNERLEYTNLTFSGDTAYITIGDSKEGWAQALDAYFNLLYNNEYNKIGHIVVNYSNIRPKGEKLKVFGGTASGYQSMMRMIDKIHKIIGQAGARDGKTRTQLQPIDLLDIANIIGENVVSGGVRRTSEIGLIDQDDPTCIQAKSNLYKQVGDRWEIDKSIAHRQMSNNSIFYTRKPTREQLHWHLQQMRYSGEPGWVNQEAGAKRRPNFNGVNPCGEILLDNHGLCNLTTVNVM
ncbi:MAG: ribonucleoside-triphosphate reductase, adenosylcobalamin-dependent, partial [Butyricicoccus pullicaecorum]|nr:ribonucleoside-triphosphate reductase, adenosylcobalamin-dependent [Butyricicoccus pullicaecorum]